MASLLQHNRNPARSIGTGTAAVASSTTSTSTSATSLTRQSSSPLSHIPKLTLNLNFRSGSSLSQREDAGTPSPASPETTRRVAAFRANTIRQAGDMSYHAAPASAPLSPLSASMGAKPSGTHAKLHKRGGSGSLPGPPSPFTSNGHAHFATPFATYEEPFPELTAPPSQTGSSTPKIKPYLRKMSAAKEDQGSIDLSKSLAENDRLAGLGIQDFTPKSASDVSFQHTGRRHHGRTTSVGSQVSNGSGSYRPGQHFTHPMTKTPRPYTPPAGRSYASSLVDDESDDVVEDEFRLGAGFRTKRSVSISSTPQTNPTPLSQSHTASDLGLLPKLTNASQSNLSVVSNHSGKSGKSKMGRPRRDTDRSDCGVSPSSRTSFDRALGMPGRRSDTEPLSRDDMIREARRKFEEKEANKNRKHQKEEEKRRASDDARLAKKNRKQSDAREKPTHKPSPLNHAATEAEKEKKRRKGSSATAVAGAEDEKTYGRSYEDYRPANSASLPKYGTAPGESEKTSRIQYSTRPAWESKNDGGWMRFSTWFQTRMLSCGGGRRRRH